MDFKVRNYSTFFLKEPGELPLTMKITDMVSIGPRI